MKKMNLKITFFLLIAFSCFKANAQEVKEFTIYSDKFEAGSASGRMGAKNAAGLKIDPSCTEMPFKGQHCLKITADGTEAWSGVQIQYINDWRTPKTKGPYANLVPYKYLVFYARSDKDYNITKIGMGGAGEFPKDEGKVPLTKDWKRYVMELGPGKRDSVNALFMVVFEGAGTIYLDDIKYADKNLPLEKSDIVYQERQAKMDSTAYYIYADKFINGSPSGYMGNKNGTSIKFDPDWKTNAYEGPKCIKVEVLPGEEWRGLHIQFTGKWNAGLTGKEPLPDLTKYKKLVFYIRTDGPEMSIPEIGVGSKDAGEELISDTYIEANKTWKRHEISIKGLELNRVNTLLFMVLPVGTFYLDEIRFSK
jgi:hypothetical protein